MGNIITYDYSVVHKIEKYISSEAEGCMYYTALSILAPTKGAKRILEGFGCDEKEHAENFKAAYCRLTGMMTPRFIVPVFWVADFKYGLNVRMSAEAEEYKKYGFDYTTSINPYLKDLFFMIRESEAVHLSRLIYIYKEEC